MFERKSLSASTIESDKPVDSVLWKIFGIVSSFARENPQLLQIVMKNPDEFFGLDRTDSAENLLKEMRVFMPLRRIVLRPETSDAPGYSLVIGTAPAGSPHTIWSAEYEVFAKEHEKSVEQYTEEIESRLEDKASFETSTSKSSQDEPYVLYDRNFNPDVFRVPLHFITWIYLEETNGDDVQLMPVDMYALANAGGRKSILNSLDLVPADKYLDLQAQLFEEINTQLDYVAQSMVNLFNNQTVPQIYEVLWSAFEKGLLAKEPGLADLYIEENEVIRYTGVGNDNQSQKYGTNRGPQSVGTIHIHAHAPTFRSRFVKLVTGRNDLTMNEEEQVRFWQLMEMIGELPLSAGTVEYKKLEDMYPGLTDTPVIGQMRDAIKQIDVYGGLISLEFLHPLKQTLQDMVQEVFPEKEITVKVFQGKATGSTMQAHRTSGWKIRLKDTPSSQAVASIFPVFERWYDAQTKIFEEFLDSIHFESTKDLFDLAELLRELDVPEEIWGVVSKLFSEFKPTQAMLRVLEERFEDEAEKDFYQDEKQSLDVIRHRQQRFARITLQNWLKSRGQQFNSSLELYEAFVNDPENAQIMRSFKKEVFGRAERIFALEKMKRDVEAGNIEVKSVSEYVADVHNTLGRNTKEAKMLKTRRKEIALGEWRSAARMVWKKNTDEDWVKKWELPHQVISRLLSELLVETGRNENMCRIPGFMFSWVEEKKLDGTVDTIIRLSPSINERGGIETIWGLLIKRK